MIRLEIPYKFPSFNEFIRECRRNRYASGDMKRKVEQDISYFINKLPQFEKPIKIHFTWIEENKRRDLDNVFYAKKFILDAMQKCGKLKNDNRKCVTAFTDQIAYAKECRVILEIEEEDTNETDNRKQTIQKS